MSKITKKEELRIKSKEVLKTFLETNNLFLYSNPYSFSSSLSIEKQKPKKEEINDYTLERYLDSSFKSINNYSNFLSFIKYCILNNHHNIAYEQVIKKNPPTKEYDLKKYITETIDTMSLNQSLYIKYIDRVRFLDVNMDIAELILNPIRSQTDKINFFTNISKTNSFKTIDNQKIIYQLIQKHIKNPEQFNSLFTNLQLNTTNKFISSNNNLFCTQIEFDLNNIMSINLESKHTKDYYLNLLKLSVEKLNKIFLELEIKEHFFQHGNNDNKIIFHIVSNKKSNEILVEFFNQIINQEVYNPKKIDIYSKDTFISYLEQKKIESHHETLSKIIQPNNQKKSNFIKI